MESTNVLLNDEQVSSKKRRNEAKKSRKTIVIVTVVLVTLLIFALLLLIPVFIGLLNDDCVITMDDGYDLRKGELTIYGEGGDVLEISGCRKIRSIVVKNDALQAAMNVTIRGIFVFTDVSRFTTLIIVCGRKLLFLLYTVNYLREYDQ